MFSKSAATINSNTDGSNQSASKRVKHAPGPKGEAVSFSFTITFSQVVENGTGMEQRKDLPLKSSRNQFQNLKLPGPLLSLKTSISLCQTVPNSLAMLLY